MTRSDLQLPAGLERALHGSNSTRTAPDPPRAPDPWELAVAAAHLALLGEHLLAPPAHLVSKLARLLAPPRPRTP